MEDHMDEWNQFKKAVMDITNYKFGIVEDEEEDEVDNAEDDNLSIDNFPDYVKNGLERVREMIRDNGQKVINVLYTPDKFVDATIVSDDDEDGALLITKYMTLLMAVANAIAKLSKDKINAVDMLMTLLDSVDEVFDGPYNEDAFLACDFVEKE